MTAVWCNKNETKCCWHLFLNYIQINTLFLFLFRDQHVINELKSRENKNIKMSPHNPFTYTFYATWLLINDQIYKFFFFFSHVKTYLTLVLRLLTLAVFANMHCLPSPWGPCWTAIGHAVSVIVSFFSASLYASLCTTKERPIPQCLLWCATIGWDGMAFFNHVL